MIAFIVSLDLSCIHSYKAPHGYGLSLRTFLIFGFRTPHSLKPAMASYFRNFFGVQPSLSGVGTQNSKSHKRSPSAPTTSADPSLSYIYAAPGTTPSSSSSRTRERSNSYVARTNTPSPLRYAAYDSGSTRSKGQYSRPSLPPLAQPPSQPPSHKPSRVHAYRSTGNKPGDRRKSSASASLNVFLKAYTLHPQSRSVSDIRSFVFVQQCSLDLELIITPWLIGVRTSSPSPTNGQLWERRTLRTKASSQTKPHLERQLEMWPTFVNPLIY